MQTATVPIVAPVIWSIGPEAWKARSKSHPQAAHTIRRQKTGDLTCTCPATVKCWHIKEIEKMTKPAAPAEPTFLPVVDPADEDPWADVPVPVTASPAPACEVQIILPSDPAYYAAWRTFSESFWS